MSERGDERSARLAAYRRGRLELPTTELVHHVVRIHADEVTHWRSPVTGATALAVSDDRLLLAGGYPPDRDRLVTGRLSAGEVEVTAEARVTLPDGGELPPHPTMIGHGAEPTVIVGHDCHRLAAP